MNEIMWKGSTQSARKIIEEMERNIGRDAIFMPQILLERNYSRALTVLENRNEPVMQEEAIYSPKRLAEAQIYLNSNQDDLAKKAFEDARIFLEQKVQEAPENPAIHASLGIAYAGLGRREEAL